MAKKETTTDDITLDDIPVDLAKSASAGIEGEVQVPVETDLTKAVENAAFAEDVLTVFLSEPRDESDFQFATVGVNGSVRAYKRGDTVQMRRKEVEVLARSKISRVQTVRQALSDGSETMVPKISYSPVYPFSVTHDPRGGVGAAWLKNILAQPA